MEYHIHPYYFIHLQNARWIKENDWMEYPQLEEEEDRLKSNHQLKEYLILVQVDDAVTEETEGVAVGTEGVAVGTEGVVVGTEGVAVGTEGVVVGTEGVAVEPKESSYQTQLIFFFVV